MKKIKLLAGCAVIPTLAVSAISIVSCNKAVEEKGGFNGKKWSEISSSINSFEQLEKATVTDALKLCKSLGVDGAKEAADVATTLELNLVGLEGKIVINNQECVVKCVGTMHDKLATNTDKYAALTFEVKTLVSDAEGKYMGVHYSEHLNNDYFNSSLRATLTGKGNGKVGWYRYDEKMDEQKLSETRTVLQMLTDSNPTLVSSLKEVQKEVAVSDTAGTAESYTVKSYNDKLFPLTYTEIGLTGAAYAKVEGSVYTYWKGKSITDRIKKPAGTTEEAVDYWLASPKTNENAGVWGITPNGILDSCGAFKNRGLSFAFCI